MNALAYVDAHFAAGSNLVANPLSAMDNSISNLFHNLPEGSFYLPWDGASQSFRPTNCYTSTDGWTEPTATLLLPGGGFLWLPAATTVTFVGEVFQGALSGLTYPPGLWVLSVMPREGFVFCGDFDECPPQPPADTTMSKWNRSTQRYETYTYLGAQPGLENGWVDENLNSVDPQLAPGESALFSVPTRFAVPDIGSTQTNSPAQVALRGVRHESTNFSFRFEAAIGAPYVVLRCTNLTVNVWQIIAQGNADPSDGLATVSVPTNGDMAFYRIRPPMSETSPYLTDPVRNGTNFQFQFFAATGIVYEVQRTASLAASAPLWQTIQNVTTDSSNVVTVTDTNATASSGYYRIRY